MTDSSALTALLGLPGHPLTLLLTSRKRKEVPLSRKGIEGMGIIPDCPIPQRHPIEDDTEVGLLQTMLRTLALLDYGFGRGKSEMTGNGKGSC